MRDEISEEDKKALVAIIMSASVDARHRKASPGLRLVAGTDCIGGGGVSAQSSHRTAAVCLVTETRAAADETLSTTAKNGRLREQRKEAWRMAEAATRYWRLRLDFSDAVEQAQRMGIPEGRYHPVADPDVRQSFEDRRSMVVRWREALVRQLLTPAPNVGSVAWKKMVLAGKQVRHTGVTPERVERAIADDLTFLAAHPVRQPNRRPRPARPDGDE